MKKNSRTDDQSPELPLLWEQLPEDSSQSGQERPGLSSRILEELSDMESADKQENDEEQPGIPADEVFSEEEVPAETAAGESEEFPPETDCLYSDVSDGAEEKIPEDVSEADAEELPDSQKFFPPEEEFESAGGGTEISAALSRGQGGCRENEAEQSRIQTGEIEPFPNPENSVKVDEKVTENTASLVAEESFDNGNGMEEQLQTEEDRPQEIFDIGPLSVGERLRSIRCSRELTLQQVASQLCTSQTNIDELENGLKKADHYGKLLVERLCGIYEIPADEFLQDFIRECPSSDEEDESGEGNGAGGRSHRHDYVFAEGTLTEARPRRERMSIPAMFLTGVIIGILLLLLGAWGRQQFQVWQEEQNGSRFRLDVLQLLPEENLPVKTLPVPKG